METSFAPAVLDAQVRALLRARSSSPTQEVLAALAWALDPSRSVPPRHLRASLRRVGDLGAPVENIGVWRGLVSKARLHVAESGTDAARERDALRVARVLIGRLAVEPVGAHAVSAQNGRLVAAAVGVQVLEQLHSGNGWLGVAVSYDELGSRLSLSDRGAARAIQTAIERKWIVRLSGGRGTPGRYRLPSTVPAALAAETDGSLYESVEALAQGLDGGEDALAVLLRSAEHAAWTVLGGSRAWGIAVAQAAGQDPTVVIGSAQRNVRSTLKTLAEVGLDHTSWTGASVREALDRVAAQPDELTGLTPAAVRAVAISDQRSRAELRAEEVRVFAADRAAARAEKRAEKGAMVQEPAQAPVEPVAHAASGELRVPLPPDFDPATDGQAFKAHWTGRGFEVVGVRLGQGHAVLRPVAQAA